MTFCQRKICTINKVFVVFSITASMVANVFLYRLNEHKDTQVEEIVNVNSAVFEYIRATSAQNYEVSDLTSRINHYTSMHDTEGDGPLKYCPECFDIMRHKNRNKKKNKQEEAMDAIITADIKLNQNPLVPNEEARKLIAELGKRGSVLYDPNIEVTASVELLKSDSVEFAQMTDRIRTLLFTISQMQKRNLSDCRHMFGTDYLERN